MPCSEQAGPRPSAGGRRAAAIYTLMELNDIDLQAWLTDVLARLQDHPAQADRRGPVLELEASAPAA